MLVKRFNAMKKFDILINTALYALYIFASCIAIMVLEMLIVELIICKIIGTYVVISPFALAIIRAVIYFFGVNTLLAVILFKDGYRSASYSVISTLISGIAASILHFIFCLLFSFEAFCAGSVKFISAICIFGNSLSNPDFDGAHDRFDCIPYFFIVAAVYIAVMIVFQKLGASKRLSDRKKLTNQNTN